jgi:hypothetical protein
VKRPFAHDATLAMGAGEDERALADSSGWRLLSSAPSEVLPGERDHARRLTT